MSKFYGYDEAMENDIAKITTPKLALMSDVVASDKKFIRMENGSLTVIAGVLIAVGNSVFKTEKPLLQRAIWTEQQLSLRWERTIAFISAILPVEMPQTLPQNSIVFPLIRHIQTVIRQLHQENRWLPLRRSQKTNSSGIPISASGAALGSGWETNVAEGIVPNSVWTLLHRPTCDPTGMVFIGPFWGDIYLSSDNGASGLQSKRVLCRLLEQRD